MNLVLQLLLSLLTWLNLSATPVLPKVTSPSYTISLLKAENQNQESERKIGVSNFARSGISENLVSQKAVLWESSVLENHVREVNVWDVQGAGIWLGDLDVLLGAGTKTKINNWEPEEPQPLFDVLDLLEDLHNYQQQENPNEIRGIQYTNLTSFIDNSRANPTEWLDSKLELRMNLIASLDLLGAFSRYSYSLEDLVYRENSSFKHVILQRESEGIATPIDPIASSTQYLNKWDTDCAFFLGFENMKMYVETVFEPVMVANVISRFSKITKSYKSFKLSRGDIDDLLKRNGGVSGAGSVFKVGDNIIGKVVQKVKPGTNGKIAVVGRQMNNHVNDVAGHLKNNQGFQVEILSDNYLNRTFNIDGVEWSVNSAWDDMVLNPAYDYMKDPITGHITIEYIEQIPMYKLNKQWIEQIQSEGFTIIDIGYPQGLTSESLFYNMEINTINW